MNTSDVANIVDAILTAILQWRVAWLDEQKQNSQPPPICRAQPKSLKITYDCYKDYESTYIPLLMHEIWAQIYEEWARLQDETSGEVPMEVDEQPGPSDSIINQLATIERPRRSSPGGLRSFQAGVVEYRNEGLYQYLLRCQYVVEADKFITQLKVISEGDLVRLDLATAIDPQQVKTPQADYIVDQIRGAAIISLFGYINDVTSERITQHTLLAECFKPYMSRLRNHHVINYNVVIAKRPLRLKLDQTMRMSCLYYLKPMIRQIESVATLQESPLASDILSPRHITCQLTVPTVITIQSPYYNNMQYKAIIGCNEALVRSIPKLQMIQGPPGTGKTHTLIGIIKHFYSNLKDTTKVPKILICAPSNGAIDEVARRLYKEREFSKNSNLRRTLRLVRIGNPDQVSESIRCISLEELVELNVKAKIETLHQRHEMQVKAMDEDLRRLDTEIANLRFTNQSAVQLETKLAKLVKELEKKKNDKTLIAKRELSEANRRNIRYDIIKGADVILTTLNSCQRHPLDMLFKGERAEFSFHCVIVDEASQCVEPELLMPLCYKISKMILIGDPMQLPATVISRYAQEFEFGRSLFERFFIHFGRYDQNSPVAMLTEQYRMHPEICRFPSLQFYDNRLISARKITEAYKLHPYILFDLRHGAESKNYKNSIENEVEAGLVRNLLIAVLTRAPENSQIGVITPYKGQKRLITSKIASLQTQRRIRVDVNTCDGFQGQEKDIIILSCVRTFDSRSSIGFLRSYQRVNVALTRAKHCLIVCISAKSLTTDKTWQALVTDANDRNCVQTLTHTPTARELENMISTWS